MSNIRDERADNRNHLHGKLDLGNERRLLKQERRRSPDGISESKPGQVANHHKENKCGLAKALSGTHLKNIAEDERVNRDIGYGRQYQPEEATHRRSELCIEFLPRKVAHQAAV